MGIVSPITNFSTSSVRDDWRGLTSHRRAIHNLEFRDSLAFVILVRWCTGSFTPNNRQFHMLNLDPYQEEVDLSNYHVLQMIPRALIR